MVIEIAKNYPDRKEFESWLIKQGHEIEYSHTSITYIDGEDISKDDNARRIFNRLEKQFKEAHYEI